MKLAFILAVAALIGSFIGCSGISQSERADFTRPEAREKFLAGHPQCLYHRQIQNGEIVRGMDIHEVMASWGLPNVYLATTGGTKEYWVYYVQVPDSRSVLIYTLAFTDTRLDGWDIDQKRFDDYRIVSDIDSSAKESGNIGVTAVRKF
jgi:hypothetical protein